MRIIDYSYYWKTKQLLIDPKKMEMKESCVPEYHRYFFDPKNHEAITYAEHILAQAYAKVGQFHYAMPQINVNDFYFVTQNIPIYLLDSAEIKDDDAATEERSFEGKNLNSICENEYDSRCIVDKLGLHCHANWENSFIYRKMGKDNSFNDPFLNTTGETRWIVLFIDRIREETKDDKTAFKHLFTKVLIHELMHALMHIDNSKVGYDTKFGRWNEELFANALTLDLLDNAADSDLFQYAREFVKSQHPTEYPLGGLYHDNFGSNVVAMARNYVYQKKVGICNDFKELWWNIINQQPIDWIALGNLEAQRGNKNIQ